MHHQGFEFAILYWHYGRLYLFIFFYLRILLVFSFCIFVIYFLFFNCSDEILFSTFLPVKINKSFFTTTLPKGPPVSSWREDRTLKSGNNFYLMEVLTICSYSRQQKLDPWFVTGFTDGEGCFILSIVENKNYKVGWRVQTLFSIELNSRDGDLLKQIQTFFSGVGSISKKSKNNSIQFLVRSTEDMKIILKHFDNYPLITEKWSDFYLLKKAYNIIESKEHLTFEGFLKILSIRASMNRGLSPKLKLAFPDVVQAIRPAVLDKKIQDPHWLAGFTSAEGCFQIRIFKSKTNIGEAALLIFSVAQHLRDEQLIKSFIAYLQCGRVEIRKDNTVEYKVTKLNDTINKIIPFFLKYLVIGVKYQDFTDWCKVAEMMKDKKHLTEEGLEQIKKIKDGINKERKI